MKLFKEIKTFFQNKFPGIFARDQQAWLSELFDGSDDTSDDEPEAFSWFDDDDSAHVSLTSSDDSVGFVGADQAGLTFSSEEGRTAHLLTQEEIDDYCNAAVIDVEQQESTSLKKSNRYR